MTSWQTLGAAIMLCVVIAPFIAIGIVDRWRVALFVAAASIAGTVVLVAGAVLAAGVIP